MKGLLNALKGLEPLIQEVREGTQVELEAGRMEERCLEVCLKARVQLNFLHSSGPLVLRMVCWSLSMLVPTTSSMNQENTPKIYPHRPM